MATSIGNRPSAAAPARSKPVAAPISAGVSTVSHLTSSQKYHGHGIDVNVDRCKTRIIVKSPQNAADIHDQPVEKQRGHRVDDAVDRARWNPTRHAKNAIEIILPMGLASLSSLAPMR